MSRLLVVEDELALRQSLCRGLREEGYQVSEATTLAEANRQIESHLPQALLLDRMLPDGDGVEILRRLRSEGRTIPTLILTARDSVQERIKGLDSGADDYLVKPFDFDELLARVRALLRRAHPADVTKSVLQVGDLELDLLRRTVKRGGISHELSQRLFELLHCLMRHPDQIVSREKLADEVWKQNTATWTNVIEVHINQLRKRIEHPDLPTILHTVRGQGYRLDSKGPRG